MKIVEGVAMLSLLSTGPTGEKNWIHPVLLSDKDRSILVDTGYPGQLPLIESALEELGLARNSLTDVILTHHDMDHIGCLKEIVQSNDLSITVMAHEYETPYIEGTLPPLRMLQMETLLKTLPPQASEPLRTLYERLKANYRQFGTSVDRHLQDGEELPFCGGVIIIHTPGHTPGHISLYLKKHRLLIAGDALFVEASMLVKAPDLVTFSPAEALLSLRKLTSYAIDTVICYHGGLYWDKVQRRLAELAATD